jgi:hypothetical protein
LLAGASAVEPPHAAGLTPGEVLARAFRNAYDLDRRLVVHLETRNQHGEVYRQRAELASKRIDGRLHTLAYFTDPKDILGTRILTVENEERSHDYFVYLPSLGTTRRITSATKSQPFLGTDLTYEEFERRRVGDFRVEAMRKTELAGESVYAVAARPRDPSSYARIEFLVATSDYALLESRYYKRDGEQPFRVIRAPRTGMRNFAGHVVATRILVQTLDTGTETEVRLEQLAVNPPLDDRLFTAKSLQYGPPIPGLR